MNLCLLLCALLPMLAKADNFGNKIAADVWADLQAPGAAVNVLVSFEGGTRAALSKCQPKNDLHLPTSNVRVRSHLLNATRTSQATVVSILKGDTPHKRRLNDDSAVVCPGLDRLQLRQIYLTNQLHIRQMSLCMAEQLALRPEVSSIRYGETLQLTAAEEAAPGANWGVQSIQAPALWAKNITGQGVVVGTIDTGVRGTHDALRNSFRGNYSWMDPVAQSPVPVDNHGHGTHTIGIVTSVAPQVQWMSCRGCSNGSCRESDLLLCMQFMLCPTNVAGGAADCTLAPRIVSNSWGSGVPNSAAYRAAIQAWRQAGIIPVFSAGNTGAKGCGSVSSPADYDNVISVGSMNSTRGLVASSSRGPTATGLMKPDLVAPGVGILSASHEADDKYIEKSGTSMAAPHVAGAIALLLSASPRLTFAEILTMLTKGASSSVATSLGLSCGAISDTAVPNHQMGYGALDVLAASSLMSTPTLAPTPTPTNSTVEAFTAQERHRCGS